MVIVDSDCNAGLNQRILDSYIAFSSTRNPNAVSAMKNVRLNFLFLVAGLVLAFIVGAMFAGQSVEPIPSSVMSGKDALKEDFEWGTFYTYHQGETYGTQDVLTGAAVIKPGWEIHPPHTHAEEEYLIVTEGQGVWHLNGEEFEAVKGDMLYAAPWDIHGVKNTGDGPLTFWVWKWNNKGTPLPEAPDEG